MTESTEIKISIGNLEYLLLNYYNKELGENINIEYKVVGDDYNKDILFEITKEIKIGVYYGKKTFYLDKDDIKNVINAELKNNRYEIDYFNYEITDNKLSGLRVNVIKIQPQKQKIK